MILMCLDPVIMAQQNKTGQNTAKKGNPVMPQKVTPMPDTLPEARNIQLIARFYGDSVVLRWAPSKATLWTFANTSGYRITRFELDHHKPVPGSEKVLTSEPLKPWSLNEWKQKANRNDSLAAACAEILYGTSKAEVPKKGNNQDINLKEALDKKYELENRHAMALFLADQSAFLATGLGLRLVDRSIEKGKTYAYSVCALTDPKVMKSDTAGVIISTAAVMPVPGMPAIRVEELDRMVRFTWNRQMAGMYFSGYNYERSSDGGKTFKQLNRHLYTQLSSGQELASESLIELDDSVPQNYKTYYYRITGITPFGDPGKPSPVMAVMGRDRTPPVPPEEIAAKNTKDNAVKITWTKRIKEADFSGYLVGRADKATGPFLPLVTQPLPTGATEYTDNTAEAHGTNYYVVAAIDTAGNAGTSVPVYVIMTDTIPPAPPSGLAGNVDTTGIVHIRWKAGKEPDMLGYMVYSANAADHIFTPVSQDFVADTTFTDSITLKTLTKHIYYEVVAFDKNRNPSAFSKPLDLKRPDKIPPVSPAIRQFFVTDSSVMLSWAVSSSTDVQSQILYRREKGGNWATYAELMPELNSYTDHKVKKQNWYEYTLEAVDSSGLHSEKSFPLNVRVYDSGQRPAAEDFTVKKSADGKSLELTWKYNAAGDFWFVIYRSVDGSELMTYRNLPPGQHEFNEPALKKGTYQYAIKAVYRDGGESAPVKSNNIQILPPGE